MNKTERNPHPPLVAHEDTDSVFRLEQAGWGVVARVESSSDYREFPELLAAAPEMFAALAHCVRAMDENRPPKKSRRADLGRHAWFLRCLEDARRIISRFPDLPIP